MQLLQSNLLAVMMILVGITSARFPCAGEKSYGGCGVEDKNGGRSTMIMTPAYSSSRGSFTCAKIKVNNEYSKVAACCVPTAMDKLDPAIGGKRLAMGDYHNMCNFVSDVANPPQ
ncbi:hypothetical protein PGT21_011915 [Puccinia graminis f. sp. tritici]|uniref:Hydrophobin n=1 Tax=Puccinia graminis f. sp. tritici TaxID=56615 RepID=A0A5B0NRK2_PUCGR|nr:hypothetical protein PGTUg99_012777 [Puccinia graminis f. sp. tritici]KAA1099564.1 hypothetical protein PGT21_011915 [Puccinia graminis f. sp. tritici]